jgi:hypothetical protein
MTVGKLQDLLSKHPADTNLVVYWEEGNPDQCFGIDGISMDTGTPSRDSSGKARFKVERDGPATRLCINISPES